MICVKYGGSGIQIWLWETVLHRPGDGALLAWGNGPLLAWGTVLCLPDGPLLAWGNVVCLLDGSMLAQGTVPCLPYSPLLAQATVLCSPREYSASCSTRNLYKKPRVSKCRRYTTFVFGSGGGTWVVVGGKGVISCTCIITFHWETKKIDLFILTLRYASFGNEGIGKCSCR